MLFRNRRDFPATIDAAASVLNVNPAVVEKDYWVSQVLIALSEGYPDDFVFKGGTSLSKGFGIIERFSEDVDILLLPKGRGSSARDTLMKKMGAAAGTAVGDHDPTRLDSSTGVHRAFEIAYPRQRDAVWLRPTIRLEIGVRGGPNPSMVRSVGTLLREALEDQDVTPEGDDLIPVDVRVLHPGRTLIEKLAMVNELGQKCAADDATELGHHVGRHFYDIYKLLDHADVLEFLQDRISFMEVVADCERVSKEQYKSNYTRPVTGYADGEAFSAPTAADRLRTAHEAAEEMYFGRGRYPSWNDVCDRVAARGQLL